MRLTGRKLPGRCGQPPGVRSRWRTTSSRRAAPGRRVPDPECAGARPTSAARSRAEGPPFRVVAQAVMLVALVESREAPRPVAGPPLDDREAVHEGRRVHLVVEGPQHAGAVADDLRQGPVGQFRIRLRFFRVAGVHMRDRGNRRRREPAASQGGQQRRGPVAEGREVAEEAVVFGLPSRAWRREWWAGRPRPDFHSRPLCSPPCPCRSPPVPRTLGSCGLGRRPIRRRKPERRSRRPGSDSGTERRRSRPCRFPHRPAATRGRAYPDSEAGAALGRASDRPGGAGRSCSSRTARWRRRNRAGSVWR